MADDSSTGPFWQALTRNVSMVRLDKMARLSYLGKTKPPGLTNGRPQPIIWTLNTCYKSPMEEIMVTKEYVELNTLKPGWQHQALQLARSQQPFVLTHFDAERDSEFYFALRGKFKLKAKMDYDGHAAIFNPKSSG